MAEVDPAYSENLEDLIETAEDLLDRVDEESDRISANQDETRRKEAQIAKCLPRSQPQKWDGSVNDFIRFKTSAKVLMEHIPNPRLALNAIIESISDPHLKKRLARYALCNPPRGPKLSRIGIRESGALRAKDHQ